MRFVEIAAADKDESASLEMLAVMKDMQEYVHTYTLRYVLLYSRHSETYCTP